MLCIKDLQQKWEKSTNLCWTEKQNAYPLHWIHIEWQSIDATIYIYLGLSPFFLLSRTYEPITKARVNRTQSRPNSPLFRGVKYLSVQLNLQWSYKETNISSWEHRNVESTPPSPNPFSAMTRPEQKNPPWSSVEQIINRAH